MKSRTKPFDNPIGWRATAVLSGGLAHYFLWFPKLKANAPICGCCALSNDARLFPERMSRRRCKTCDRSATKRGMT